MLKIQLHSKIFQVDLAWRKNEDILTGDFFGVLDYLPRDPYLRDFISYIVSLNPNVQTPCCDEIAWDKTEIRFWPRIYTDEENAEPDIVIISNKWVLVIEIKLQSGLGDTQPWREYVIGHKIAEDNGVSPDSVYYLVVAQEHLDISRTFKPNQSKQCNELSVRTAYLKWHEAVSLIDSWLRNGIAGEKTIAEDKRRMLSDLYRALRRRRAIAFSGFGFENIGCVGAAFDSIFCPPRFTGYLQNTPQTELVQNYVFLRQEFKGFGSHFSRECSTDSFAFFDNTFNGFLQTNPDVNSVSNSLFFPSVFSSFLNTGPTCTKNEYIFFKGLNP